MCSAFEMIIPLAFALAIGLNIFGGSYFVQFLARLELHHPNEWIALGKPQATDDPVHFKGTGVFRYFFHKEYERLADQVTVNLGHQARRWLAIGLVSGTALIVLLASARHSVASTLGFGCWFR